MRPNTEIRMSITAANISRRISFRNPESGFQCLLLKKDGETEQGRVDAEAITKAANGGRGGAAGVTSLSPWGWMFR
jgi:hypothetical protein